MNPFSLFTSFSGRIGRRAYLGGLLALLLVSPLSIGAALSSDPFTEAASTIRQMGLAGLAWTAALFLPLAALNTKRLHDLGKSGAHAVLFYAPAALASLQAFTGFMAFAEQAVAYTAVIAGWLGLASAWFLFQLGLKAGTPGPNRYGERPGASSSSRTSAA